MSRKTSPIYNADAVADHLERLKAEAKEDDMWWTSALKFRFEAVRKSEATGWFDVNYTSEAGVTGRLRVRILGERHSGQILPNTEDGLAEVASRFKGKKGVMKVRDRKPAFQFQKWNARVETEEDGVTPILGDDGQPVLPPDSARSNYYRLAALVDEAWYAEADMRVKRGAELVTRVLAAKKAQESSAAIAAAVGGKKKGDLIVTSAQMGDIRKVFPAKADQDLLMKNAQLVPSAQIARLVQERISDKATNNAGCLLPNPMARISMSFNKDTGVMEKMQVYDKTKPYMEGAMQRFEAAKVPGKDGELEPLHANNVHKFVLAGSLVDGIVDMDSGCLSSMGISMPVSAAVLAVEPPSRSEVSLDDLYGGETPSPTASAKGGEGAADAAGAAPDGEIDDLIDSLEA